jgi:hypothetical protein
MQRLKKQRIFDNLSYIPRKPHGLYYNKITQIPGKIQYNKSPSKIISRNIIDPFKINNYHSNIISISRKTNELLTVHDALHIWSFVKILMRNTFDRIHELILSDQSYFNSQEKYIRNQVLNKTKIDPTELRSFIRGVKGHLTVISYQSDRILEYSDIYRNLIIKIMRMRINNTQRFIKLKVFISDYFKNNKQIIRNIRNTIKIFEKKLDIYSKAA